MLNEASVITFIQTRDRVVAEAFYGGTLGLTRLPGDDFAAVYELGGGAKLRLTHIPDWQAGPHPALGWQVADVAAAVDALAAQGVTMTFYPGMGQDARGIWTSPDGGAKVVFFADPDGNGLSLTQVL
jgi:catechol-2,3-dioxygenase